MLTITIPKALPNTDVKFQRQSIAKIGLHRIDVNIRYAHRSASLLPDALENIKNENLPHSVTLCACAYSRWYHWVASRKQERKLESPETMEAISAARLPHACLLAIS